jgi:uncharacterized membrane protein YjjB (DUF3815 family)
MITSTTLIYILAGVFGTIGFSILFRLKPLHWLYAGIVGFFTCVAYFIGLEIFDGVLAPNILGAFVCALSSEFFARIGKAPATVFLLPGIITLVPGRTLYYTMSELMNNNYIEAGHNLLLTVEVAVALGGGIIGASILRIIIFNTCDRIKKRR